MKDAVAVLVGALFVKSDGDGGGVKVVKDVAQFRTRDGPIPQKGGHAGAVFGVQGVAEGPRPRGGSDNRPRRMIRL